MTRHYPGLGSASDWLKQNSLWFQPITSTTYIWVVTRHQYGISALITQTSFCEGSSTMSGPVQGLTQTSQCIAIAISDDDDDDPDLTVYCNSNQ